MAIRNTARRESEKMANLYGRMMDTHYSGRVQVTRTAATEIWTRLETWDGSIDVTLNRDGEFVVRVGEKNYPTKVIATGNVNEEAYAA